MLFWVFSVNVQLTVPIIYTLLWSEYNHRHALEIAKVYSQEHLTFINFLVAPW